jgi:hypothetical protein
MKHQLLIELSEWFCNLNTKAISNNISLGKGVSIELSVMLNCIIYMKYTLCNNIGRLSFTTQDLTSLRYVRRDRR